MVIVRSALRCLAPASGADSIAAGLENRLLQPRRSPCVAVVRRRAIGGFFDWRQRLMNCLQRRIPRRAAH